VPLITPEQQDQLIRTTPIVVIGVKRELEGELKSNNSKVRVIGERVYSKADCPPKSYYRKKAEDLRQ